MLKRVYAFVVDALLRVRALLQPSSVRAQSFSGRGKCICGFEGCLGDLAFYEHLTECEKRGVFQQRVEEIMREEKKPA